MSLLSVHFLDNTTVNATEAGRSAWVSAPCAKPGRSFWLLVLAWPQLGCDDQQFKGLCHPFGNSSCQINKYLQKKKNIKKIWVNISKESIEECHIRHGKMFNLLVIREMQIKTRMRSHYVSMSAVSTLRLELYTQSRIWYIQGILSSSSSSSTWRHFSRRNENLGLYKHLHGSIHCSSTQKKKIVNQSVSPSIRDWINRDIFMQWDTNQH